MYNFRHIRYLLAKSCSAANSGLFRKQQADIQTSIFIIIKKKRVRIQILKLRIKINVPQENLTDL